MLQGAVYSWQILQTLVGLGMLFHVKSGPNTEAGVAVSKCCQVSNDGEPESECTRHGTSSFVSSGSVIPDVMNIHCFVRAINFTS